MNPTLNVEPMNPNPLNLVNPVNPVNPLPTGILIFTFDPEDQAGAARRAVPPQLAPFHAGAQARSFLPRFSSPPAPPR